MNYLLILLGISFAVSAVGWFYFIYFFSIGYGLAISALSVGTAVLFWEQLPLPAAILLGVLFVYGLRLALYLFLRERRSASYKKILYQPELTTRKPFFVMVMIWVSCALLYIGQISPVTFYLANLTEGATVNPVWAWVGAVVAALGVVIEAVADQQKSAAKKVNASRFVSHGLYRFVRLM